MEKIKIITSTSEIHPERIVLLAGSGQNVGKTTFACQLIERIISLGEKVYSVKISPHFHEENPEKTIYKDENYILSLESQKDSGKDSSRMLKAGAQESFFLQVKDNYLKEGFNYLLSFIPKDVFLVIESGGLRNIIHPALFFFMKNEDSKILKESSKKHGAEADRIIHFNGSDFDFNMEQIILNNGMIELKK